MSPLWRRAQPTMSQREQAELQRGVTAVVDLDVSAWPGSETNSAKRAESAFRQLGRHPIPSGLIGGALGYHLLRYIGRRAAAGQTGCDGSAYHNRSKIEALFGPRIWEALVAKVVIDFGCGTGEDVVDIAQRGARRVIGIDRREDVLELARSGADKAGVSDRCFFTTATSERADAILSIFGFEHYDDPERILRVLRQLVRPDGRVFIAFGPLWFHPLGGHLFSVFPWAHLVFTEHALIRWRSEFKRDGARRFSEVAGGLNQMTISRFEELLANSDFLIESFEAVPIRKLRPLANRWTREFVTSIVRCTLVPLRETR